MNVTVTEALASQLSDVESFLKSVRNSESSRRNDYEMFRPTLETLDKLTVAVHAARVPATSFLSSEPQTGARFDASDENFTKVLNRAVAYLRDPDVASFAQKDLSRYNFHVTKEALDRLKALYFGITVGVWKAAEADLRELHSSSLGIFLASAEVIRQWAADAS